MRFSTITQKAWRAYAPSAPVALWLKLLHSIPPGREWRSLALWVRKPLKDSLSELVEGYECDALELLFSHKPPRYVDGAERWFMIGETNSPRFYKKQLQTH